MLVRVLLAMFVFLGLMTGSPAFAAGCGPDSAPAACGCCPMGDVQPEPCCAGEPSQDGALPPSVVRVNGAELKMAILPDLRLVGMIPDGKELTVLCTRHEAPVEREGPLLKRLGILLI